MKNKRKLNIGIEILRIILSFIIVANHFGPIGGPFLYSFTLSIAVPSFMMVSFYFFGDFLKGGAIPFATILKKIKRLLIPFFVWGIVYFIYFSILSKQILFKSLLFQVTFGSPLNPLMYFIFLQIVFVFIFFGINHLFRKNTKVILLSILFICLLIQYTNINYEYIHGLRIELSYSLGRIVELFPSAILGLFLKEYVTPYINKKKLNFDTTKLFVTCLLFVVLGAIVDWLFSSKGFGYQGLGKLITAFGVTSFFIFFPFRNIKTDLVTTVSSLTLGIFCVQILVGSLLTRLSIYCVGQDVGNGLVKTIIIYLGSFLLSYFIANLPMQFAKRVVS